MLTGLLVGCGSSLLNPSSDCPEGTQRDPKDGTCVEAETVCNEGFYGVPCSPCDCLYGDCNQGSQGDGSCSCEQGWLGNRCDKVDANNPPAAMRIEVEKDGELRTLVLQRYSVWAGGQRHARIVAASGIDDMDLESAVRNYRGYCEEEPDAIVSAFLPPSGSLRYDIYRGDPKRDWGFVPAEEYDPAKAAEIRFKVIGGQAIPPSAMPLPDATFHATEAGTDPLRQNTYRSHMALLLSKSYLDELKEKDLQRVVHKAESSIARMNATYLRDVFTETHISEIVIRQDGDPDWDQGRAELLATFPKATPNHVFTITNEKGSGLAYVCQLGGATSNEQQNRYAVGKAGLSDDGGFYVVIRHEFGHNLGSDHYEGGAPEGPTILSGNSLSRLSSYEVEVMLQCREPGKGAEATRYAEPLGSYTEALVPPYARLDDKVVASLGGMAVDIDVMANDHDGNGEAVALSAHDPQSAMGGELYLKPGKGERDRITYIPPQIDFSSITVGRCAPGEELDATTCSQCTPQAFNPAQACTTSDACGSKGRCVGGFCRQAPTCSEGSIVDACGRPCKTNALRLWLDASDRSTLRDSNNLGGTQIGDGAAITTWFDLSGYGNNALGHSTTPAPTLMLGQEGNLAERSNLRFKDALLSLPSVDLRASTHPVMISFAVVRHESGEGGKMIWVQEQNGFSKRAHSAEGTNIGNATLSRVLFDATKQESQYAVLGIEQPATSSPLDPGGASIALGALLYPAAGSEGFYFSDFVLAELLIYTQALSAGERRAIELYLMKKWQLPLRDEFKYSIADPSGMRGDGRVQIKLNP